MTIQAIERQTRQPGKLTKRQLALKNFQRIVGVLEEHHNEAEKEGNEEFCACLQQVLDGLHKAEIPNALGQVKVVLELA